MIQAVRDALEWRRLTLEFRRAVRAQIEAEGGTVQSAGPIGLILRSPFPALGDRPLYLQVVCSYEGDSGVWYVRRAYDGSTTWVWKSRTGSATAPVSRPERVLVKNDVLAFPAWVSWVGFVLLAVVMLGGPLWLVFR